MKIDMKHSLQYSVFNKNIDVSIANLGSKSILDVGCGKGRYCEWAKKRNMEYFGIDIDPKVVKIAENTYGDKYFKIMAADKLEFEDDSFDTLLLIEFIEHIQSLELIYKILKECKRVARKNIFIQTPNCEDYEVLKKYGLTYIHYTHVVEAGMQFKTDLSHKHWFHFTPKTLNPILGNIFENYKIVKGAPIDILKITSYNKIWAEIQI